MKKKEKEITGAITELVKPIDWDFVKKQILIFVIFISLVGICLGIIFYARDVYLFSIWEESLNIGLGGNKVDYKNKAIIRSLTAPAKDVGPTSEEERGGISSSVPKENTAKISEGILNSLTAPVPE